MNKVRILTTVIVGIAIMPAVPRAAFRQPVRARHGMVASTSEIASRVGVEIMQRGGNAIDAAVAVGLALAVVWPAAGNLGGGGFMMIRRSDGRTEIVDYREKAPTAASRDMYLDKSGKVIEGASTVGYRAVGVPGSVAGLAMAEERHGRLKWTDVVEPALKLARDGFTLNIPPPTVSRAARRCCPNSRTAAGSFCAAATCTKKARHWFKPSSLQL